jgi:transcriptional regulator with XRE-family HTH domain
MSMRQFAPLPPAFLADYRRQFWGRAFGEFICGTREAGGRSIEECARLAGMEVSEWDAIENGYVPQDEGRLRSMAAALEIGYEQMASMVLLCREAWEL